MKRYIAKLEELLKNNCSIAKTEIAVSTDDMYLIHAFGYKEHSFSIKITTFPESMICFFGYDKEILLPLNDKSFVQIVDLIAKAIKYGTQISVIENGINTHTYEFISEKEVTGKSGLNLYLSEVKRNGEKLVSCTLLISDLCGSNVFEVDVSQSSAAN